jgi:tetratricopeptide (TPR) repeat protein
MNRIVGFGVERGELPATATRAEVIEQRMEILAHCLSMRTTVAFVGAGCSLSLGYPDWPSLARKAIAKTQEALASRNETEYAAAAARLAQYGFATNGSECLNTDQFLVRLGFCQRISEKLEADGHGNPYRDFLSATFSGEHSVDRTLDNPSNPYFALLQLPIYRFITTNYDLELEHALASSALDRKRYGLEAGCDKPSRLSFTQTDEYVSQLSKFFLAQKEKPSTVFHCHGRYDEHDSMIITERDYRRWYLRSSTAGEAFRQNIELLFGSNPILFIGFSMRDNDLLRALRILNADDPSRQPPRVRNLFALLPDSDDETADRDRDELLYERYHVDVIPYNPRDSSASGKPTKEEWGRALCRKLMEIHDSSLDIRKSYLHKPSIRKVVVPARPPQPYLHYAVVRPGSDDLSTQRKQSDLEQLTTLLKEKSLIVMTGYGGSGKSWRVLDLIEHVTQNRHRFDFDGIFFWSSYYANDWLTGVDRALVYFGSEASTRTTRIKRFAMCLQEKRHLVVFDGFERLLRDHGSAAEGKPASRAVVELLDAAREGKSKVILTSRLMPEIPKDDERVGRFGMRRTTTDELVRGDVFGAMINEGYLNSDDLTTVCSLCDGHSYALALAAAYLRSEGSRGVRARMDRLRFKLSNVSPTQRLSTMIDLAVDDVQTRTGEYAKSILERVAIFTSPVTDAMMKICTNDEPRDPERQALLEARLLFRVSADPESIDVPHGYTVHPTVRSVLQHPSGDDRYSMPNFMLPGFTSGSQPIHPGSTKSIHNVKEMFGRMHKAAERALESGDLERAGQLCRGAFGVVRSQMEVNSVARWTTYDSFLANFEIPLAILVKRVAPSMWDYMERSHAPNKEDKNGPLFADELAWLWNDIGLAFYAQGAMADAHAVYELSYEIDRVTDSYEEGGQYLVQSRLHMAGTFLEMGDLYAAAEYLTDTERSNLSYGDEEYAGRIAGYKALLAHLRGNSDEAGRLYEEADKLLQKAGRNLRGRSIFAQHHADLKTSIREFNGAASLVRTSTALAEEGNHDDLIAYARNSEGHRLRELKRFRDAQFEYEAALRQARKTGIRRLESDVLCELARLELCLGDWETARLRVVASLKIANELWLGLRCTNGLVVLGKAMIGEHNPKLGAAYLQHARTLARKQGYLLCVQEAEKALRDQGELTEETLEEDPCEMP